MCVKFFEGHSKAMECDAICDLVRKSLVLLKGYMRCIVLDDNKTILANLKEDIGAKLKGKLEACLAGLPVIADPSHRKRTYQEHCFKLTGGVRKKGWALIKDQAKKLTSKLK